MLSCVGLDMGALLAARDGIASESGVVSFVYFSLFEAWLLSKYVAIVQCMV